MCFQENEREISPESTREFCFEFEAKRFQTEQQIVTATQIRKIVGGIPGDIPIVEVLEDGTQKTLTETESISLVHCVRVRRLPRFTRG